MKDVVTSRDFQRNISTYLKARKNLVVTKDGLKSFEIVFFDRNPVVTTPINIPISDEKHPVVTTEAICRDKQQTIANLRKKTEEILEPTGSGHYCLKCQKIGKLVEAVGEFEVTAEDGEHKAWLCPKHKRVELVFS